MTEKSSRAIIAKNLRQARVNKHWTQAEAASKSGLNTNYYAKIERGDIWPAYETLEKIFKALGVKSSQIFPT